MLGVGHIICSSVPLATLLVVLASSHHSVVAETATGLLGLAIQHVQHLMTGHNMAEHWCLTMMQCTIIESLCNNGIHTNNSSQLMPHLPFSSQEGLCEFLYENKYKLGCGSM